MWIVLMIVDHLIKCFSDEHESKTIQRKRIKFIAAKVESQCIHLLISVYWKKCIRFFNRRLSTHLTNRICRHDKWTECDSWNLTNFLSKSVNAYSKQTEFSAWIQLNTNNCGVNDVVIIVFITYCAHKYCCDWRSALNNACTYSSHFGSSEMHSISKTLPCSQSARERISVWMVFEAEIAGNALWIWQGA